MPLDFPSSPAVGQYYNGYIWDGTVWDSALQPSVPALLTTAPVYANESARTTAVPSPAEGQLSYLNDVNQFQGYTGSAWKGLGTVLQVASVTKTDIFSTTSTAFVDVTGLTLTLTPASTASKFFVSFAIQTSNPSPDSSGLALLRNGSQIGQPTGTSSPTAGLLTTRVDVAMVPYQILDSPATASAVTYKVQVREAGSMTAYINRRAGDAVYGWSSTLTVMEIAG